MANTQIQRLNLNDFLGGDADQKTLFVERLNRAFREIGFVVITGHNVSAALQKRAYEKIAAFFALPVTEKAKLEQKGIGGARGYTSFGKEHAKDSNIGDLKEFFHVGIEVPAGHPLAEKYPPNVSVPQIEGFDTTLRELYTELLTLGTHLLRALTPPLGVSPDYFDEKVRYGNSILRPIHYPPLTGFEEPGALRSAAHEDINLITLLIGASTPGLEVFSKQREWIPIQTEATEIVVNVGDMLQRLTNHDLVSTTHRVVNPPLPPNGQSSTRFSIPFFLHPVSEMSLEALPYSVKAGEKPREAPILAGDYLAQRLREIGLT